MHCILAASIPLTRGSRRMPSTMRTSYAGEMLDMLNTTSLTSTYRCILMTRRYAVSLMDLTNRIRKSRADKRWCVRSLQEGHLHSWAPVQGSVLGCKWNIYLEVIELDAASPQKYSNVEFITPLVTSMMKEDPEQRPTAEEALARYKEIQGRTGRLQSLWRLRKKDESGGMRLLRDIHSAILIFTYILSKSSQLYIFWVVCTN